MADAYGWGRQRNIPGAIRVEEAGDAEDRIAAEGHGVNEVVVDAAVDDVDPPQPTRRPHVDDVVVGDEVAAFDQLNSHLAREVSVLKVRRVEDARRE